MSQSHENHSKPDRDPIDLRVRITVASVVTIGTAACYALFWFLTGANLS